MEQQRDARPTSDAAEPTLEQARDEERPTPEEDDEDADKASQDSFPTSDPPAW